jgi:hypothetical protein
MSINPGTKVGQAQPHDLIGPGGALGRLPTISIWSIPTDPSG